MSNVLSYSSFKATDITVSPPKKKGDRLNAIMLANNSPVYFESPLSSAPFGVTNFSGDTQQNFSLNLSLSDSEYSAEWDKFDEYMIDYGVKHSKIIFGKEYKESQRAVVEALYTRCMKRDANDTDSQYPPRIAPKFLRDRENSSRPNVLFYHSSDEEVSVDSFDQLVELVPKGIKMKIIFSGRPWFISGRFGVSFNVHQILAPKKMLSRPNTFAFNDEGEVPKEHVVEENEDEDSTNNDAVNSDAENSDSDAENSDEDDEEDEEDEEDDDDEDLEPEPEPEPVKKAPAKKGGRKPASKK